jgi:hypothetical protein
MARTNSCFVQAQKRKHLALSHGQFLLVLRVEQGVKEAVFGHKENIE